MGLLILHDQVTATVKHAETSQNAIGRIAVYLEPASEHAKILKGSEAYSASLEN